MASRHRIAFSSGAGYIAVAVAVVVAVAVAVASWIRLISPELGESALQ